jgi:glycogenin
MATTQLRDTAYVTLATNDPYALGALVLCHALKRTGTAHATAVLVTEGVSAEMLHRLETTFDSVHAVSALDTNDARALDLLRRPELGVTATKLHVWRLRQYSKIVFLDADVLPVQSLDDLFDRPELAAAPDAGWPDCFNSGVFVCVPSEVTFSALFNMLSSEGSFDGTVAPCGCVWDLPGASNRTHAGARGPAGTKGATRVC